MSKWKYLVAGSAMCAALAFADASDEPPPGPGLDLIKQSCVSCHDIYMITSKRKTPDDWATLVGLMADRGAEVTPEEIDVIAEYLAKNYPSNPPAAK
jgi:mono/diheme cytochrome c family protein